jgi:hypothetical protein
MDKQDIIRMALEAGFLKHENALYTNHRFGDCLEEMERFAALVSSAEREACAKLCDDISSKYKWPEDTAEKVASQWCADAIRARGQA